MYMLVHLDHQYESLDTKDNKINEWDIFALYSGENDLAISPPNTTRFTAN